ncbi:CynX/NimT family MFS transporter [Salinisphaera sp. LB1]|uniref:MFS transporter n=1 Tax=Salinisphaera sp. LB1 TaxID=2183911 RepID=UPI000D7079CF|nr:MFS transporter [Salinisphaera sp. LB1]AWN17108.1 Cyanate transport protein CynX [Salinisphaera sp. LB1]
MADATIRRHHYTLFAAAVLVVGLNLRPIMAAIGPILGPIQSDTSVSDAVAGLLTTLPVLAMGIFALFGGLLQRMLGVEKTVLYGLIAVGIASLTRVVFYDEPGLIATAALGGVGIAVIQAVLPGLIKRDHADRAGQLMALYTTGIMAGAMISSSASAPLSRAIGWPESLSIWSIFAVIAFVIWSAATTGRKRIEGSSGHALPLGSARAWYLLVFFGIGTSAYTLVLAWLPPFYVQRGWSGTSSGLLLGGLTLTQVIAAVGLSSVVDRFTDRRPILLLILVLIGCGLLCLLIAPKPLAIPALLLLGIGIGGLFPMSLIVTADHLQEAGQAGALMGFVQGGGYIVASIMPFVSGILREQLHDLTMAWLVMLAGIAVQILMVPRLSPQYSLSKTDWRLCKNSL